MVPKAGLEPARGYPLPPQDSVSTKFHHFGTCINVEYFILLEQVLQAVRFPALVENFFQVQPVQPAVLWALSYPS